MIDEVTYERKARKRHKCDRQRYWDRLSPESRAWHRATECPEGGWIEPGTRYTESEGEDEFHPSRWHQACYVSELAR